MLWWAVKARCAPSPASVPRSTPSCQAQASTGRLFALVTSGFAARHGLPGLANTLCAVDVSDPTSPVETCRVRAGVPRTPEGIFVSGDTAYVGGVSSNLLAAFDLRNLAEGEMPCVGALADPAFKQCVGQNTSAATPPRCRGVPDGAAVLLAGGLGDFALPGNGQPPTELSRLVLQKLAMANRVVRGRHSCAAAPRRRDAAGRPRARRRERGARAAAAHAPQLHQP